MLTKSIMLQSAALGLIMAAPAHAQTSSDESEVARATSSDDIVVTAQRREQSMLSVPIAITAVTGAALANAGVSDSSQLATVVPNLQINSAYGKTQPNFSLRGIGVGNEYSANQASPIGVYIDDAYIASRTSQGAQLYDLERIEVLRGPQGTLFGRNTTGGAINMITRKPDLSGSSGYVEASYGNYDTLHGQAALETTLVEDQLGIRIAANYDRNDPTFRNLIPGKPSPNGGTSYSGRVQLRWKPVPELDVLLKAYGSKDKLTQGALHSVGASRREPIRSPAIRATGWVSTRSNMAMPASAGPTAMASSERFPTRRATVSRFTR